MAKLSLEQRTELKKKTAESLTDPNFIALTTLDNNDGEFISLKTKIKHVNPCPIKLELQYSEQEDVIKYHYQQGQDNFYGKVSLTEENDEVLTQLTIDKIKRGENLINAVTAKGKVGHIHNGGFIKINENAFQNVNYWIPTVINHIAKNANRYITKKISKIPKVTLETNEEGVIVLKPRNQYSSQTSIEDSGITRISTPKSPHFRSHFTRTLEDYEGILPKTIDISGFYVKTDWAALQTSEVIQSINENATEMFPLYFNNTLLPRIVQAGHDKEKVLKAFLSKN